ncbi:MAG: ATP-binding protein [Verrucomicrobiae bacterium]|nr:ATP-binding protein [Verrucomicrobiae bacterium]
MSSSNENGKKGDSDSRVVELTSKIRVLEELLAATKQSSLENARQLEDANAKLTALNERMAAEIRERQGADVEILRLNRLFAVLSQVNQLLVRSRSKEELFGQICRIGVEHGNFKMVWIGWVDETTRQVVPTACAGEPREYVQDIRIYADERPEGRGPTGACIREGRSFICNDLLNSPQMQPWIERIRQTPLRSTAAFPIRFKQKVCGALVLYSDAPGFFKTREIELLDEVVMDISFGLDRMEDERRRCVMERELHRISLLQQAIFDSANMTIISTTNDGTIRSFNTSAERWLGYKAEEVVEKTNPGIFHDQEEVIERAKALSKKLGRNIEPGFEVFTAKARRGMPDEREWTYIRKDGSRFPVFLSITGLFDARGECNGFLGIAIDISERKRMEAALAKNMADLVEINQLLQTNQAQLVQSEKMASLGQLAAGVAHEINNPVGFVRSNLGTLQEYTEAFKKLHSLCVTLVDAVGNGDIVRQQMIVRQIQSLDQKENLDFIMGDIGHLLKESMDGADRVKEIVLNLKSFARLDEAELKDANINECIESTLKIIWNELKYKCRVSKKLGDLPSIQCYPGQINQVLMNLLVNAAQSIPEKGDIAIETEAREREIIIRISDTGKGIAPENMPKLFTPFFTTKPTGKGTGLGLSISYGIIQKHRGSIEAASEEGKGTTFTIRLPIGNGKEGTPPVAGKDAEK